MRNPTGYGSVIKLSGKRRRPYAVRTSEIIEYIDIYTDKVPQNDILKELKRLKFRWNAKQYLWSAVSSDKTRAYAESLNNKYSIRSKICFRQSYKFHAYFEKPALAYQYLADLNNGAVIAEHKKYTDSPTFAEMYDKWKKYKLSLKKKIGKSTWNNYETAYVRFEDIHQRKFISLKTEDIQNVLNKYNYMSASSMGNMRTVVKALYSYAIMNGYVDTDLSRYLVFEWTDTDEIHSPYTEEEIDILWNKLYEVNNVDILLIYIYTGMRPAELLNILTEDVHIDEQYMIGGSKTEAGIDRIIPIADKILPLVKGRYDPDKKYLITNKFGNHYTYGSYVGANFDTVMRKLNMQHLPHDSRHTFATLMDKAEANEVCTKLIMGHSLKSDITKGIYTHKTVADLLAEVNKL